MQRLKRPERWQRWKRPDERLRKQKQLRKRLRKTERLRRQRLGRNSCNCYPITKLPHVLLRKKRLRGCQRPVREWH